MSLEPSRDRILNGHQASALSAISLYSDFFSGGGVRISSITAGTMTPYDPADPTKILVKFRDAGGNLAANPANDSTGEIVDNEAFRTFEVNDIEPDAYVIAAKAFVRIAGSGGEEPALALVELRYPDAPNGIYGTPIANMQPVAVSATPKLFSANLPDDVLWPATLNGAHIRARSGV